MDLPTSVFKAALPLLEKLPLRVLTVGGERLGEVEWHAGYPVLDIYGPTEFTTNTTFADISARISADSVGLPYQNTKCYVLDAEHRRVPYGAVGELYLSGYQLSSGYINRPEKNAE